EPPRCQILAAHALASACAAMGPFADVKAGCTSGRSSRVAGAGVEPGRRVGLSAALLNRLRPAALVHELGRVAVSTAIWDRPGRLSILQQDQVRLFPLHGERILSRASGLRPEAALVGLQREALDG